MTKKEISNEYHKIKEDDSTNKFKIYSGDLIIPNKGEDKFLLCFTPKEIDFQCFCGFDLNFGMKLVCCFLFYMVAFHFLEIIVANNYRTYFIGSFMCAGYLITIFNIFQVLEEISYDKSAFIYRFFMILFFLEIIRLTLETICLKIYDPLYFKSYSYLGIFLSYSILIITLLFEDYMVWITFCFMEHIKNNNIYLLHTIDDNNLFSIST